MEILCCTSFCFDIFEVLHSPRSYMEGKTAENLLLAFLNLGTMNILVGIMGMKSNKHFLKKSAINEIIAGRHKHYRHLVIYRLETIYF